MSAKYSCVVADPPWTFGDKLPGKKRGAAKNYSVMGLDDIKGLRRWPHGPCLDCAPHDWHLEECVYCDCNSYRLPTALAMCDKRFKLADDALLFLWRVNSMPQEALDVVKAWGFVPKSEITWVKTTKPFDIDDEFDSRELLAEELPDIDPAFHGQIDSAFRTLLDRFQQPYLHKLHFGMGRYVRMCDEKCIIAARGKAASLIKNHSERSVFLAPVPRDARGKIIHSAKPPEFYSIVERLVGGKARKLELFARQPREGWTTAGDEIGVVKF